MHALLMVLALGVVHEDHKSRFRLDLADGWKWNPQPGDTAGTWFRKSETGALANLGVRVVKLDRTKPLSTLMAEAEAAASHAAGYRKLGEAQTPVAGKPATLRQYKQFVAGDDRTVKRVDDYFFQNGEYAFWIHFEALADGYDLFHDDLTKMLASFVPLSGGQSAGVARAGLIGRWQKTDDDLIMDLRPDGTFTLGPAAGTYLAEKAALILRMPDGNEERFGIVLVDDDLTVSGPHLDLPIHYTRIVHRKALHLAGVWKPRTKSIPVLRLKPGGQFAFGGMSGSYKQKGDTLTLHTTGSEKHYTFSLEGDVLKVTGGDLPFEVLFDRGR